MSVEAILIASHPRSGTHLVIDTLRRQFPATRNWRLWGLPLDHLYLNLERLDAPCRRFDDALVGRILARARRPLMKTHFLPDFSESWTAAESRPPPAPWDAAVAAARVIYVTRHPLDVMSSYLQFMSGIDPAVRKMSLSEFIFSPHWTGQTDRLGWWLRHVAAWRNRPGALHLRYEDIIRHPQVTLERVADHLAEPLARLQPWLPPKNTSVLKTRADRLLRLSPQSTAIIADKLRYPLQRWREALDEATCQAVQDRCGDLLPALGYDLAPRQRVVS